VVKSLPANAGDVGLIPKIPLEKEMATHSSIPAWEIPQTNLVVTVKGLQRVGFNDQTTTTCK
jgi:hypothetical protein